MKNEYTQPKILILEISATDVISVSGFDPDKRGEDEVGYQW